MRLASAVTIVSLILCVELCAEELLKPVSAPGAGPTLDGLQATVRTVKEDFGPGESILLHWRLSNTSDTQKVVKVSRDLRYPGFFTFTITQDGRALSHRLNPMDVTPVERTLRAGGQLDLWLDLRALSWAEPQWLDQQGNYEVVVNYLGGGGRELPSGKATFRLVAAGTPSFPRIDPALAERIQTLITQLGADDFRRREQAQAQLLEIGKDALGPLTEALTKVADPEIRLRCQNLIDRIREGHHHVPADEVLCERCRGRAFTADIGQCRQCAGHTPSGAWTYCPACAQRLNRCAACGQARVPPPILVPQPHPVPPPMPPPAPVPPPVIPPDDF